MTLEQIAFLSEVRKLSQDPEMMNRIIDVAILGLRDATRQAVNRAADMEVVASIALNNRLFKGKELFLAETLGKWEGKTSLRWDDQIAKLKGSAPTAEWQPIDTAPMDGTVFWGYRNGSHAEACRIPRDDCEMWEFRGVSASVDINPHLKPTHWRPLPSEPKVQP
jgi:hypothetical protein